MSTRRSRGFWIPKHPETGASRGPNHRAWCKNCAAYRGEYVEVPAGRQTFCSTECWRHYAERNDPNYVRAEVFKRDRGICARCGLDTEAFQKLVLRWQGAADRIRKTRDRHGAPLAPEHNTWLRLVGAKVKRGWGDQPFIADPTDRFGGWWFQQGAYCYLDDRDAARYWQHFGERRVVDGKAMSGLERMGFTRGLYDSWWDADHILPVVEGGGECDLSNYRTLCLPCHKAVTRDLHRRLTTQRRVAQGKPAETPQEQRRRLLVPLPLEMV